MKKQITISHLVVNGCSFTYGDGLDDPTTQAWPALLANKLGVPVVNIAMGGTSNDRIYRKTVDYFLKDVGSNPFYIIGMTSDTRREEYRRSGEEYLPLNLISNHRTPGTWGAKVEELLAQEMDFLPLLKRKYDIWLAIINLFRSNQTEYLVIDMINNNHHILIQEMIQIYPELYEYVINDDHHLKDYLEFVSELPKLPCGHDDAVAQVEIAKYIHDAMLERYDIVIDSNNDHLAVKDFYTPKEIEIAKGVHRGHWII